MTCATHAIGDEPTPGFDILLRGGRVVDGTGAPWYEADVAVRDGRIAKIGRIPEESAERVIDCAGLIVCPGFIDMMGQTGEPFLDDPESALNLLTQGITTINAGEGHSPAPILDEQQQNHRWRSVGEYFLLLELSGMPVNVAQTVGHTQVRRVVLGEIDRRPTDDELERMQDYVRQAMDDGAIGLSTALIYPPAVFGTTEEIAALAAAAGESGGRYYTHMRNEGDQLLEAIDEALEIGRSGGVPVHIFHLKAAGRQNWGKIDEAVARINAARAAGQQVTADIYPYVNNGLGLAAFIHPRHFAEGHEALVRRLDDPDLRAEIRQEMEELPGWENWYRHIGQDWNNVVLGSINAPDYRDYAGKSLAEIATATDKDPWDVFFEITRHGAFALPRSMSEANKIKLMQQPFISFCTDVGPAGGSGIASHPRAWGSFPRILSRYVRELGAVSLEQAVSQATSVAANEIMAYDRGRISEGLAADIVVFSFEEITDRATLSEPATPSTGIRYVLVNGEVVLEGGEMTEARPGHVLRGPGYRIDRAPYSISQGDFDPALAPFDNLMRDFMRQHGIPGAALAVTDHGRLVFARGYGYADVAEQTPATPTSLFRIASISKPITATAVLQFVDRGELSLDDHVFDILDGYEPYLPEGREPDPRMGEITIRQLLQHTGGWDRDESFDAMFKSVEFANNLGVDPPAGPEVIIRNMLGQPLDFDPGARYAYSNYGYCLLGRVIEQLSGRSYEDYVKEHVLAPLGITRMRIGHTRIDGRAEDEVRYYFGEQGESVFAEDLGKPVPWPYGGWYLEAMDSHGAWIASAVDLVRIASAFDDPENCPVLSAESVRAMFAGPPDAVSRDPDDPETTYYGLGWGIRTIEDSDAVNAWHTGSLAGTATLLVRDHEGRNWAVVFNARRDPLVNHFGVAIDRPLHRAADAVTDWPEIDLFDE